jgi:hypothetical protein
MICMGLMTLAALYPDLSRPVFMSTFPPLKGMQDSFNLKDRLQLLYIQHTLLQVVIGLMLRIQIQNALWPAQIRSDT